SRDAVFALLHLAGLSRPLRALGVRVLQCPKTPLFVFSLKRASIQNRQRSDSPTFLIYSQSRKRPERRSGHAGAQQSHFVSGICPETRLKPPTGKILFT